MNKATSRVKALAPLGVALGLVLATSPQADACELADSLQGPCVSAAFAGARTSSSHASSAASPARQGAWHEVTVERGDTLSAIFARLDVYGDLHRILALGAKVKTLDALYPGQDLDIRISERGIEELVYEATQTERLRVRRGRDGFSAALEARAFDIDATVASGRVQHSLFLAGRRAGLSVALVMKLAELFGWDVDFALDIRKGDRFTVVYEEYSRDGETLRQGDIIAAEFVNRGQTFRALRYTDADGHTGYYTPEGRSVRRPFLRNPVSIARVSSRFNLKRRHPILNRIRAHRGVDYAAPRGTPIKASGDGTVVHRGRKGGYGHAIVLRHGNKYTTLYGHMSRYARGTRRGSRVEQGQTIGYIGSSGLATGPHLHYEFRIHGVHRNPLTVKLPAAAPLPDAEMARFRAQTAPLQAKLDVQGGGEQIAMSEAGAGAH